MKIKRTMMMLMCIGMAASFTGCGGDLEREMYSSSGGAVLNEYTPAEYGEADGSMEAEADGGYDAEMAEEAVPAADLAADTPKTAGEILSDEAQKSIDEQTEKIPEKLAGVLTAGEWNDNDNWGFFRNLLSTGNINIPDYCLNIANRMRVDITDKSGEPLANAKAELCDGDGNIIWTAISGENGAAYLFYPNTPAENLAEVRISLGDVSETVPVEISGNDSGQGENSGNDDIISAVLDTSANSKENMQVMFILDTTGSMGDEMLFLQSEFGAIAEAVGSENIEYSVNFYRDHGDDYVTKCNGFTNDTNEIVKLLNGESASGGGDTPEAVAEILTETMIDTQWNDDSVKVAFLIFDAPPHSDKKEELERAVSSASEQGIRIVPVVSSNSERDTEIFARTLSIATNGTYVFLTDDSGVGGSHLEPIIGDYQVELLQDIIIRIINDYRQN
ncbi:MAG: VWA domain-containing protein [Ruminococcus sp.]|nr:VWA domain-containing protein [Ruminococcus sp.]